MKARADRITPEAAEPSPATTRRSVKAAEAVPVRQMLTELAELRPGGKVVVPAGQNVRMDVLFLERAYKATARSPTPSTTT